uniref:Uncharacterized protein n=1 Tax=Amphimedon queenslandica TaxID=400682 RepID=A0A1X7UK48_AMPQE
MEREDESPSKKSLPFWCLGSANSSVEVSLGVQEDAGSANSSSMSFEADCAKQLETEKVFIDSYQTLH